MLQFADLSLNPDTREVRRGERSISLTRTEFSLLELLLSYPRRVLTRAQILEQVWGYDFPTTGNALEVYIGYLRRKTEAGRRAAADPHRARGRVRAARVAPVTTQPRRSRPTAYRPLRRPGTSRCAPGSGCSPPWPPRVAVILVSVVAFFIVRQNILASLDANLLQRATAAAQSELVDPQQLASTPTGALGAGDIRLALLYENGLAQSARGAATAPPLGAEELAVARGEASRRCAPRPTAGCSTGWWRSTRGRAARW